MIPTENFFVPILLKILPNLKLLDNSIILLLILPAVILCIEFGNHFEKTLEYPHSG